MWKREEIKTLSSEPNRSLTIGGLVKAVGLALSAWLLRLVDKIAIPETCKQRWQAIVTDVRLVSALLQHPATPWYAKAIAGCALGYIISPVQIIPNFIPLIGQLDDVLVLYGSLKLLRKLTPPEILMSCHARSAGTPESQVIGLARLPVHGSNSVE